MRVAAIAVLLAAAIVVVACGVTVGRQNAYAQRHTGPSGGVQDVELIAFTSDSAEGVQQLIVIDPKTHVLSVYHVPRSTGQVTLKSVRNIHWDLQMDEFNGEAPSPREIRSLLKPR
jgi:hypothetical protein